jgi:hypothetical protein
MSNDASVLSEDGRRRGQQVASVAKAGSRSVPHAPERQAIITRRNPEAKNLHAKLGSGRLVAP